MGDWNQIDQVLENKLGTRIVKKPFRYSLLMGVNRAFDLLFFAGLSSQLHRTRIFFSNNDLEHIKTCATPPSGTPGDGWVSTQEALAAHLLLSLGRVLLSREHAGAVTGVDLWLDVRQKLGLSKNEVFGLGFTTHNCLVENLLEKELWEVAVNIHDEMKNFTAQKVLEFQGAMLGVFRQNLGPDCVFEIMQREHVHPRKGKYDLHLQLNNQSKRVLPDFGDAGGLSSTVLTNSGPSLVLPAPGGVELFLVDAVFNGATSSKKLECIKAISELPSAAKASCGRSAFIGGA